MTREEAIWYLTPIAESASLERYKEALSMAVAALREQEKRRWIPVEERLPQNYISVLVCIPTAEPLPMVHEAYIGDDGEWHSSVFYGIENEDVTHWMPMPKPPKGE